MSTLASAQTVIAPLEDRLRERLATLKTNRETFIVDAQRQLAALDAAIGEMTALLEPPPPPSPDANGASDAEAN